MQLHVCAFGFSRIWCAAVSPAAAYNHRNQRLIMNRIPIVVAALPPAQSCFSSSRKLWITSRFAFLLPTWMAFSLVAAFQARAASSIWNDSFLPAIPSVADNSVTVGVKFQSQVDGSITGIRFYKALGNGGNTMAGLWTTAGTKLATLVFTNETAAGWQEQSFASPVAITANTTYVVTYFASNGFYAATAPYFAVGNYVNAPLVALGDGVDGGNGVFSYGAVETFPVNTFNSANYWVDVVFETAPNPCGNDTNAPVILECAADRTLAAGANSQASLPDLTGEVLAEDDCPLPLLVTQNPPAGTLLGLGQHLVFLAVTDASSNSATCSATMTVEPQSSSGVIGDFVWNDLNQNGIQDSGEPGLPGVRVRLFDCATDYLIATQFTDAAGHYRFEGDWTNSL